MEVGSWGGNGGTSWDDGIHDGVREIHLVYGHCIDSMLVVYDDRNNRPVKGEKHGGSGGSSSAEVKLQYPDEYLVSVSGHYCTMVYGGNPIIRSLTFKTNKRTFGPFGLEVGTPFGFQLEGHHIIGFKGRSDWYLDAIGFHISRVPSKSLLQRVNKTFKRLTGIAPKTTDGKKQGPQCR